MVRCTIMLECLLSFLVIQVEHHIQRIPQSISNPFSTYLQPGRGECITRAARSTKRTIAMANIGVPELPKRKTTWENCPYRLTLFLYRPNLWPLSFQELSRLEDVYGLVSVATSRL
jgi:hypothetical protein